MAERILIAEHMVANRISLTATLSPVYDVFTASNVVELLAQTKFLRPDLILLAGDLPGEPANVVCRQLRAQTGCTTTLVIICQAPDADRSRHAILSAGANTLLPRCPDAGLLCATVRTNLFRVTADRELADSTFDLPDFGLREVDPSDRPAKGGITLVPNQFTTGTKWRDALALRLRDRIEVVDRRRALQDVRRSPPPDAIVVECDNKGPDIAINLLSELRCHKETRDTAALLVHHGVSPKAQCRALDLNAANLVEGFEPDAVSLLIRRELARKSSNDRRRRVLKNGLRLALIDPLTGLHNRRYAKAHLGRIALRSDQSGAPLAVLVIDLDRFKQVNDAYGHPGGDTVLVEVANRMRQVMRGQDILARIGGEEFLAILPSCDLSSAQIAAERLRRSVCNDLISLGSGAGQVEIRVTTSIGVAIGGTDAAPKLPADLIKLADQALYAAKQEGRDQVSILQSAA